MSSVEALPGPRKRQRRSPAEEPSGSAASHQAEAADGPRTMKESDMWPETVLKALNEYGLLTQLTANPAGPPAAPERETGKEDDSATEKKQASQPAEVKPVAKAFEPAAKRKRKGNDAAPAKPAGKEKAAAKAKVKNKK